MKKTIVYIDGYNLYYGLLKGTQWKWLDLVKFSRSLLTEDQEVVAVKYFTSRALTYPHDNAAIERQNVYLQAILTLSGIKVVNGFFRKDTVLMPAYEDSCKNCNVPRKGLVRVVRLEEKRSDVNLAVEIMLDAAQSNAECLAVVTGDADQVGTIDAARRRFGKTVLVFNPQRTVSDHLRRVASYYRNIPRDLPARCQLPDVVPLPNGHAVRRPAAW